MIERPIPVSGMERLHFVSDAHSFRTCRTWRHNFALAAIGTHNPPSVASIRTSVPEQHPGMTTTLKHFESGEMPPAAKMLGGLTIAPAMAPVVVDRVPIVDP